MSFRGVRLLGTIAFGLLVSQNTMAEAPGEKRATYLGATEK